MLNSNIGVMADAVWPAEESKKEENSKAANEMFGGLDQIPMNERSAVVQKRLKADRYSSALFAFGICLFAITLFAIPIVLGTFVGYLLQNRSLPVWLFAIRYLFAWWALSIVSIDTTLICASPFVSEISLRSDWWKLPIGFSVCLLFAWLVLRRWRKPKLKVGVSV